MWRTTGHKPDPEDCIVSERNITAYLEYRMDEQVIGKSRARILGLA